MKSFVLIAFLLIFLLPCSLASADRRVPEFGYAVSGRGYDLPAVSPIEHAAVDFLWQPSGGNLTIRAGISVPVGDQWFAQSVFTAGIDVTMFRMKEHLFWKWISHDSRYAPAVGTGAAVVLTEEPTFLFLGSLQPLRFEVGGGMLSIISPALYWKPGDDNPHVPAGWGITLFDFGYYIW